MSNDLDLKLRISQDGSEATAEHLGPLKKGVDGIGDAAKESTAALAPLKKGFGEIGDAAQKAFFIVEVLSQIGEKAADIGELSDEWQSMKGRLDGVSDSQAAANANLEAVIGIANRTRSEIQGVNDLYVTNSKVIKGLGRDTAEAAIATETIAKAMKLGGGAAAGQEAALIQLTQALQANRLGGEELSSILEQAPGLADVLARALNVTTGELRSMGEQGQLTSSLVIAAMVSQSTAVDAAFAKLPLTIGQAGTQIKNRMLEIVGGFADTTGAASGVANALSFVAQHLDEIAAIVGGGAMAAGATALAKMALAARDSFIAHQQAAVAAREQAVATQQATLAATNEAIAAEAAAKARYNHALALQASARAAIVALEQQAATNAALLQDAAFTKQLTAAKAQLATTTHALSAATAEYAAAQRASMVSSTAATGAAAAGVTGLSRAFSLLGGPVGAIMLAVGALAYFVSGQEDSAQATAQLNEKLEEQYQKLSKLSQGELAKYIEGIEQQIAAQKRAVAQAEERIQVEEALNGSLAGEGDDLTLLDRTTEIELARARLAEETNRLREMEDRLAQAKDRTSTASQRAAIESAKQELRAKEQVTGLQQASTALGNYAKELKTVGDAATGSLKAQADIEAAAGNTARALDLQSQAAERSAKTAIEVATALQAQAQADQSAYEKTVAMAEADGQWTAEEQKTAEALRKTAVESRAAADAAAAQALQSKAAATQAEIAAKTFGDQADKVDALRAAYERSKTALQENARLQAEGTRAAEARKQAEEVLAQAESELKRQKDELTQAQRELNAALADGSAEAPAMKRGVEELERAYSQNSRSVEALRGQVAELRTTEQAGTEAGKQEAEAKKQQAVALGQYRDALNEVIAASERRLSQLQTLAELDQRQIELRQNQVQSQQQLNQSEADTLRVRAQTAQALGDEKRAQELLTQAKQKDEDASRNQVQQARLEAQAAREAVEAKRAQIAELERLLQVKIELADADGERTAEEQEQIQTAEQAVAAAKAQADQLEATAVAASKNAAAISRLKEANKKLADAQQQAVNKEKSLSEQNEIFLKQGQQITSLTLVVRQRYYDLSEAAGKLFDRMMANVHSLEQWRDALADRTFERIKGQFEDMAGLVDRLTEKLQSGQFSAQELEQAGRLANSAFSLLGDQQLAPLRSALEQAKQLTESARDSAQGMLEGILQRLYQAKGLLVDLENLDYQRQRRELESALQAAIQVGDAATVGMIRQAIAALEELHQINLARIREQADAEQSIGQAVTNTTTTITAQTAVVNQLGEAFHFVTQQAMEMKRAVEQMPKKTTVDVDLSFRAKGGRNAVKAWMDALNEVARGFTS